MIKVNSYSYGAFKIQLVLLFSQMPSFFEQPSSPTPAPPKKGVPLFSGPLLAGATEGTFGTGSVIDHPDTLA